MRARTAFSALKMPKFWSRQWRKPMPKASRRWAPFRPMRSFRRRCEANGSSSSPATMIRVMRRSNRFTATEASISRRGCPWCGCRLTTVRPSTLPVRASPVKTAWSWPRHAPRPWRRVGPRSGRRRALWRGVEDMAGQPQQVGGRDRQSAEPLYAQIARLVGEEIQAGRLPAGAALPSEASLCTRFGVARSVVRQALSVLQSEGLIRKEQGRAAIVAARAELRRMVQRSTGLYEQFASSGMLLRTRILKLEKAVPPPEVAEFFGSQNGWLLERLR